jgi:hypothetical protein
MRAARAAAVRGGLELGQRRPRGIQGPPLDQADGHRRERRVHHVTADESNARRRGPGRVWRVKRMP